MAKLIKLLLLIMIGMAWFAASFAVQFLYATPESEKQDSKEESFIANGGGFEDGLAGWHPL